MLTPHIVKVGKTLYGKGLFAIRDISKGEVFATEGNQQIFTQEYVDSLNSKDKQEFYFYAEKCKNGTYSLDLDDAKYINHSCDSNVLDDGEKWIFVKDVKTGEEVTYDYRKYANPDEEPIECKCNSPVCCKKVIQKNPVPKILSTKWDKLLQKAKQK